MRRQSDGWVNATHILKVANFDKPQRTRILEREVQRGVHEKVQGGYGKYQGTWVPLERARAIASQYKVTDILEPIFSYSPATTSETPAAPRHTWRTRSTPTAAASAASKAAATSSVSGGMVTRRRGTGAAAGDLDDDFDADGNHSGDDERDGADMNGNVHRIASGGNKSNTKRARRVLSAATTLPPPKKRRGRKPVAIAPAPRKYRYGALPGSIHSTPRQSAGSTVATPVGSHSGGGDIPSVGDYDDTRGSFSPDSASVSSRSSSPSDFMSESDIDAALTNGQQQEQQQSSTRNAITTLSSKRRIVTTPNNNYNNNNNYYANGHVENHPYNNETQQHYNQHQQLQQQEQYQHSQNIQHSYQQHEQQLHQQHQQQQHQQHQQQQLSRHQQQLRHNRNDSNSEYTSIDRNSGINNGMVRGIVDSEMLTAMYSNKLLDYFMAGDDGNNIPEFLIHPPSEFKINQMIDDEGHTAFHWACAMGDLKIIEVLLNAGADVNAMNLAGETPLIRAIMFTNNYDRRTFPKVVDLLRHTIFYVDSHKQTVLHHIASTTSSRSKLSSTRYYTEIILAKISETQNMSVVAEFVNRQDDNGDTALHIAARNGARKCVKVLLGYSAMAEIVNNNGRTAQEYISEYEAQKQQLLQQMDSLAHAKSSSSPINGYSSRNTNGAGGANGSYLLMSTPGRGRYTQLGNDATINVGGGGTGGGTGGGINGTTNADDIDGEGDDDVTAGRLAAATPMANGIININGPNHPAYPPFGNAHDSEVAIKATQRIAPAMIESLEELAVAYDAGLREKDADVEQVRDLLESMKRDIANTERAIAEQEEQLGDEQSINTRLQQANQLVNSCALQLRKLVERTQARDLAMLVQVEEDRASTQLQQQIAEKNEENNGNNNNNSNYSSGINGTIGVGRGDSSGISDGNSKTVGQVISLASVLIDLQTERKKLVDEIVELCANAGVGEKMNDYRRLVSLSCGVKLEEIDDLLDGIAQALLSDTGGDDFSRRGN